MGCLKIPYYLRQEAGKKEVLFQKDTIALFEERHFLDVRDYQYHLKDHLGNVRLTFSTTHEFYEMKEDFEGGDNGFTDLHLHTDANANTTTPLASSDGVGLLQSGETGAMVFLSMNKGDTIDLSVKANYETAPTGNSFLGTAYSALFSSFDGSFGSGVENGVTSSSSVFDDVLAGADMANKGSTSDAPRAFLNYIFFDRDMNYESAGFLQISTAALRTAPNDYEQISLNEIIADQEGYILAYVSNENSQPVNIFFDDFEVYHGKTNVVFASDYYPFGYGFSEYNRTASAPQRFRYNSFELDENTGLYDYLARQYDPLIGRFTSVDPAAELMRRWSTYAYAFNNPIRFIDPDGMMGQDVVDGPCGNQPCPEEQQQQATQQQEKEPSYRERLSKQNQEVSDAYSEGGLLSAIGKVGEIIVRNAKATFQDSNIEGDGELQEGGEVVTKQEGGASSTKNTAKNVDGEIDSEGMDQLGKGTSSSGNVPTSMANMLSSASGLLPTPSSETTNTSQSSDNNGGGSQSGTGNSRTFIERRPWFSVGSKRQGVDSTFQNSNGSLKTDRWLLRDATGGFTKTKIN